MAAPRTFVSLAVALLALATLAAPAGAQTQPNIVLIFTDDQRWDTLSAMPKVQRTLVDRGVNFTNGFVVNSLCCPSRASMLTGQLSRSTGVYTNSGPRGYRAFREESTIATWLQAAGYRTAYIGKYLNGYRPPHIPPGWSRWVSFAQTSTRFYNYTLNVDGAAVAYGSDPAHYSTDVLTGEAVSFIEETPGAFFLMFAPSAPHAPATPAPRHQNAFQALAPWRPASFDEEDVSDKPEWVRSLPRITPERQAALDAFRRNQLGSLLAVDDAVGAIVDTLERTGRLQDTLIVFTSDNGIAWGEHRHMTKLDPYEESIRVPLVVRYDRAVTTPRAEAAPVLNIDLAPTFAAAAGVLAPAVDGASFLPLLQAPGSAWRQDFIVEHVAMYASAFGVPLPRMPTYCALRSPGWTYVAYETGEEELYDLYGDPHQLTNLASHPAFASRLTAFRKRLARLCNPPPPIVCTMKGTRRADVLYGTPGYEVVCAYDGGDLVTAGAGNDVVAAGRGHDDVYGGPGNDRVSGHSGDDIVYGGAGNDRVNGYYGHDIVYGGAGDDDVTGDAGDDAIYAGRDNDRIAAGGGRDRLYDGPGDDTTDARDGLRDIVWCGTGRDLVFADRVDRVSRRCEVVRRARARR